MARTTLTGNQHPVTFDQVSTSLPYRLAVRTARALAPLASRLDSKLADAVSARRAVTERLSAFGTSGRDDHRPLAWFHAPSVGEGLQARAVLDEFRSRHPGWQVAYTWFSPSAEAFGQAIHADYADCLPWDIGREVDTAIANLRPQLLVFAKLDVWPELATRVREHGASAALVAGTVRPRSGRLSPVIRRLLRPGYEALEAVGAVSDEDATRLVSLGVAREKITVTGDPRADSVLEAVERTSVEGLPPALLDGAPTLVAGSTWPEDEDVLLEAFASVRARLPHVRLVLVPHEPVPKALERIDDRARALGLPPPIRLSTLDSPSPLVVVDSVGILATLYGVATLAYVGGGFTREGLHSVLEPAVWAVPVIVGPRWQESRDAERLVLAGGARSLPARGASAVLQLFWREWVEKEGERATAGRRGQELVLAERGAAARSADLLDRLLQPRA